MEPSDPKKVENRVWEREIPQWDPRVEIMSTNETCSGGIAGLEKKNGVVRPENRDNPGLREENIAVGPAMRNYVNQ